MGGIERVTELRAKLLLAHARLEHKTELLGAISPLLVAYQQDVTACNDELNEAILENRHRIKLAWSNPSPIIKPAPPPVEKELA